MSEHGPCWPWCKEFLEKLTHQEIARIESILDEREKATVLLAQNQLDKQSSEMIEKYVLQDTHRIEIKGLQNQLTGPLGLELRMRALEQAKGSLDAKLYMVIVGIPLAVSAIIYILMNHIFKGG